MTDRIFVSVASYCDALLAHTLLNAITTAKHPERLVFGIVEQAPIEKQLRTIGAVKENFRYVGIDPLDARGVCWARALAMSLYQGEEWFLQIDSHMVFDQDWDERMIEGAKTCPSDKPLVTNYPVGFRIDMDTGVVTKESLKGALRHIVNKNEPSFKKENLTLSIIAAPIASNDPIAGCFVAAGFMFAPGKLVNEVPYDPKFYFHGEEQSYALRAYTHGWDIFHVPDMPIYHLYDTNPDNCYRPKHWTKEIDEQRNVRWWELQKFAHARFDQLVAGADLGVYSLGKVRSIEDYREFSGVDYLNKTLDPKVLQAGWDKPKEEQK